ILAVFFFSFTDGFLNWPAAHFFLALVVPQGNQQNKCLYTGAAGRSPASQITYFFLPTQQINANHPPEFYFLFH
ncbi:hypothetical protein, partial [Escherichia coli]|uniref:hypothetical protein n=1 Tax=Escherichia coli TaxID=562 RepID=UPI001BC8684D